MASEIDAAFGDVNEIIGLDGDVIADFAFVHEIKKTGERGQSSQFSFRKLEENEKQSLLKTLSEDESFSTWLK